MIDNYDSFTYNLVQYLGELGARVEVHRNDQIGIAQIEEKRRRERINRIVVSPGPCTPKEAGISVELIRRFAGRVPILGVCLGHQAISTAFGGEVVRARRLMHGKTSLIQHDGKGIFAGLPQSFEATRYHSLIVPEESLPDALAVSARTPEGEVMAIRHRRYRVDGVQFHPESIMTRPGKDLLKNFLAEARA